MSFVVTEKCVNCGKCVDSCPAGAIEIANNVAVINADECIECGLCAADCDVEAIVEKN